MNDFILGLACLALIGAVLLVVAVMAAPLPALAGFPAMLEPLLPLWKVLAS